MQVLYDRAVFMPLPLVARWLYDTLESKSTMDKTHLSHSGSNHSAMKARFCSMKCITSLTQVLLSYWLKLDSEATVLVSCTSVLVGGTRLPRLLRSSEL